MKILTNKAKLREILLRVSDTIRPPKRLLPSQWTEASVYAVDGVAAGSLIKLHPYQRGMIDAITEGKRKVIFKTSAQLGKTLILNSIIFYRMANDPCNIAICQATTRELNQWVNSKVRPSIEASPALKSLVTDKNDKTAVNNSSQMQLKSGQFLFFMSLTSPSHLRGKVCPVIIMDETDAASISEEGDPIQLAEQRATTFGDEAIIVIASTPTTRDGAINQQWLLTDQRKWFVPCPHCGQYQTIEWENVKFQWHNIAGRSLPNPDTAQYVCPHCETAWTEGDRIRAVARGEWRATVENAEYIGFHANRLMSPFSSIKACVSDFATAYANHSLVTFYNTVLGETYSDLIEERTADELELLKEHTVDIENIPDDVCFLTAGVDQQLDRLECTILGIHRKGYYVLDHRSFYDTNCERHESPAYDQLLAFLKAKFRTVSGHRVPMLSAFVDSSNGRATNVIYRFCNRWSNLHSIKGASAVEAPIIPAVPTRKGGHELFMLGVNQLKKLIREMINRNLRDGEPHTKLVISGSVPDDYTEQLLSEELVKTGTGIRWKKTSNARNEALDCLGYSLASAAFVLSKNSWDKLFAIRAKMSDSDSVAVDTHEDSPKNAVETHTGASKPISKSTPRPKLRALQRRTESWVTRF